MEHDLDPRFIDLIFDNIPCGIFTVDSESRITYFNSAAETITGWTSTAVLGRPCSDIFHNTLCRDSCFLRDSIRRAETHSDKEARITRRDGRNLLVSISTAALRNRQGEIVGGVEMFRDITALARLREELKGCYTYSDIVATSKAMQLVKELLPMVAQSQSAVLIEGEPGTGKELVARAIHNLGSRAKLPFVALNCGALPDDLAESELFGYMKGAFTGASRDKPGRFAMAEGGTLLLDEVGELSRAMQVKLLRVLQEGEYMPLGGVKSLKADVRIIAATNRELAVEVAERRFRQDLYYRLNVVQIHLPPLRIRDGDIPLLVGHFIQRYNLQQGRRISDISENAMVCLREHDFPGNVRELENAIEHAFVVCGGNTIRSIDLPALIREGRSVAGRKISRNPDGPTSILHEAERHAVQEALASSGGQRGAAAAMLGISRSTLWRKMKRLNIE